MAIPWPTRNKDPKKWPWWASPARLSWVAFTPPPRPLTEDFSCVANANSYSDSRQDTGGQHTGDRNVPSASLLCARAFQGRVLHFWRCALLGVHCRSPANGEILADPLAPFTVLRHRKVFWRACIPDTSSWRCTRPRESLEVDFDVRRTPAPVWPANRHGGLQALA